MTGTGGVVVTGASSGIGAEVARRLHKEGFEVFGTVRRAEDQLLLEEEGIVSIDLDVRNEPSVARAAAAVSEHLQGLPLWGLVNNAGVPCAGPLERLSIDEVRNAFNVNVLGVLTVLQAFLPLLKEAKGRVVNMSSVSGRIALPFLGGYAATKFALEAISDSLRRELIPFDVDVIVIEPGAVRTPIWDKVAALNLDYLDKTAYQPVLHRLRTEAVSGGRQGLSPSAVADAVVHALTADSPPCRIPVVRSRTRWLLGRLLPPRWLDKLVARRVWGSAERP